MATGQAEVSFEKKINQQGCNSFSSPLPSGGHFQMGDECLQQLCTVVWQCLSSLG